MKDLRKIVDEKKQPECKPRIPNGNLVRFFCACLKVLLRGGGGWSFKRVTSENQIMCTVRTEMITI